MALVDTWETDPTDAESIWQLMIGKNDEDPEETDAHCSIILDGIYQSGHALEIGAGVGRLIAAMRKRCDFRSISGVDSSLTMVTASSNYLQWETQGRVNDIARSAVVLNNGLILPFADRSFSFVYSYTCFQHMVSLAMIHRNLSETCRVLKSGGVCRIQTIISGDDDPHNSELFDGRVAKSAEEFASWFRNADLEPYMIRTGLTHPKHCWITARKAM